MEMFHESLEKHTNKTDHKVTVFVFSFFIYFFACKGQKYLRKSSIIVLFWCWDMYFNMHVWKKQASFQSFKIWQQI